MTVKATTTPTPTPAPANTTIDYDNKIADQVKATLTANSSCIVNGSCTGHTVSGTWTADSTTKDDCAILVESGSHRIILKEQK